MSEDHDDSVAPMDGPVSGLFKSLSNLLATLIAIAQTRIELIATDLQAEVRHGGEILIWALVASFAGTMAIFAASLLVVVLLWDTSYRMIASVGVVAFFAAIALVAALVLKAKIRGKPRLLEGTREELAKDKEQLSRRGGQ